MFWQVPAHSSKALQAIGASLWVSTESEAEAALASQGALQMLAATHWAVCPRQKAVIWGWTSEAGSDLCSRQAPVPSSHAEEHQEPRIFKLASMAMERRDWRCRGRGANHVRRLGGCVVPGTGLVLALKAVWVRTSPRRMITGTCGTGQICAA